MQDKLGIKGDNKVWNFIFLLSYMFNLSLTRWFVTMTLTIYLYFGYDAMIALKVYFV